MIFFRILVIKNEGPSRYFCPIVPPYGIVRDNSIVSVVRIFQSKSFSCSGFKVAHKMTLVVVETRIDALFRYCVSGIVVFANRMRMHSRVFLFDRHFAILCDDTIW